MTVYLNYKDIIKEIFYMYSDLIEGEIPLDYSIQGECFGFYISNGYMGIQVEDDGTWFNSVGPFLLSRSSELIRIIEALIKIPNGENVCMDIHLPPFEVGVKGTSFCLGVSDEYLAEIEKEYQDNAGYHLNESRDKDNNEFDILLEFTPGTRASTHWIKDLAITLPSFKVLINNISHI